MRLQQQSKAVTVRVEGPRGLRAHIAGAIAAGALVAVGLAPASAAPRKPDWDQSANIKDAAQRIAEIQRTQGATKAFNYIDDCYKTHSLSSEYTKAFEGCIAQDYLETQILALVYSRLPPETLKKMGAPEPKQLAQSMGQRITAAFATYKIPVARVEKFKKIVDEDGFPVFFKALFPGVEVPKLNRGPAPDQKAPGPANKPPEKAPAKSPDQK
jgi:hypothetical protein